MVFGRETSVFGKENATAALFSDFESVLCFVVVPKGVGALVDIGGNCEELIVFFFISLFFVEDSNGFVVEVSVVEDDEVGPLLVPSKLEAPKGVGAFTDNGGKATDLLFPFLTATLTVGLVA